VAFSPLGMDNRSIRFARPDVLFLCQQRGHFLVVFEQLLGTVLPE
jgi:hypothetical protein